MTGSNSSEFEERIYTGIRHTRQRKVGKLTVPDSRDVVCKNEGYKEILH